VGVEAADGRFQLGLAGRGGQVLSEGVDADLGGVAVLEAHVGGAGRVVPHQDSAQPGLDPGACQLGHPLGEVLPDLGGQGGAVEDARRHQCRKWRSPVRTMARPCSSAAAIISSSRRPPPGWITTATPAPAAASTPSRKGSKASLAQAPPLARPAALRAAISPASTRVCWAAPMPTACPLATRTLALVLTWRLPRPASSAPV